MRLPSWVSSGRISSIVVVVAVAALAFTAGSVFDVAGQNGDETFYACLYAGSFTQINTTGYPSNCGRGEPVSWSGSGADGVGFQYTVARIGEQTATDGDELARSYAACLPGEWATGGGPRSTGAVGVPFTEVLNSSPALVDADTGDYISVAGDGDQPNGWVVDMKNHGPEDTVFQFQATVVCAGIAEAPPTT